MLRWLCFLFSRVLLVQEKLRVFYVWQGHFWVLHSKMPCLNWTHLMTGIKTLMLLENLGIIFTYLLICFAELFKSVLYYEREGYSPICWFVLQNFLNLSYIMKEKGNKEEMGYILKRISEKTERKSWYFQKIKEKNHVTHIFNCTLLWFIKSLQITLIVRPEPCQPQRVVQTCQSTSNVCCKGLLCEGYKANILFRFSVPSALCVDVYVSNL